MSLNSTLKKWNERVPTKTIILIYLGFVIYTYMALPIGFKPELFDNTWTHYWTYDYVNNGITEDRLRGDGLANLNVTGITPAFVYGHIMNLIGWELPKTLVISTFFVLSGLGLWSLYLKDRGWSRTGIFVFAVMGLLLDILFEPAHTSKSDAFTFFMLSLAFYLFTKEHYLPAGVAAIMCVESHPIGITVFFYMLGHFIGNRKAILAEYKIRPFILFGMGIAIGIGYYFGLHYHGLFQSGYSLNTTLDENSGMFYFSSYMYKYFFSGKYGRHIPELIIFAAGWFLGLKNGYFKKETGFYWMLLLVALSSVLNPRQVHTYIIHAYPAMAMAALYAAERLKIRKLFLTAVLLLMLPQYMIIFREARTWPPRRDYIETIRNNLPPDKSVPVLGSGSEWFACLGEREYHHTSRLRYAQHYRPERLYMIVENDGHKDKVTDLYRDEYDYRKISEFDNYGELFEIFEMAKKKENQ